MAITVQGERSKSSWLVFVVAVNIGVVVLTGCCHLDKGSDKGKEQSGSTDRRNEQSVKDPDSAAQIDELAKARVLADRFMIDLALQYDRDEAPQRAKRIERAISEAIAKDGPQSETASIIAKAAAEIEGKDLYQSKLVKSEDRGVDILFVYELTRPYTVSTSNHVSLVYEKASGTVRNLRGP